MMGERVLYRVIIEGMFIVLGLLFVGTLIVTGLLLVCMPAIEEGWAF